MALDPQLQARVIAQLQQKWRTSTCPMCGQNTWEVHGHVTLNLGNVPGVLQVGGPVLPTVAVVCQVCGNTVLVNLVALGLMKGA